MGKKMKYQYFIASRWRNKDQVVDLVNKIRQKGKTVYSFFEGDGSYYDLKDSEGKYTPAEFMKKFESTANWFTDKGVKEVFDVDINALKESETLILLLPAGKSAHVEAGIAYGLDKKLIVIGEQKEAESSYMIFNEMFPTIDDFRKSLLG